MLTKPDLSDAPSSRVFSSKFKLADKAAATELLDALKLLNEAYVAQLIHQQLDRVARTRKGRHLDALTTHRAAAHQRARKFASRSA